MIELTPAQQEFIRKIVSIKDASKIDGRRIADLQIAKIIRESINVFAIRWENEPTRSLSLYFEGDPDDEDKSWKDNSTYFQLAELLYSIKTLKDAGFIQLQQLSQTREQQNSNMIFNRKLYDYDAETNMFWRKPKDAKIPGLENIKEITYLVSLKGWHVFYTDLVELLDEYATAIIFPLPAAELYVANGCRTIEQVHYDEQNAKTVKSLKYTRNTLIITCIALIVSLGLGIWQHFSSQKIDDTQIERIESAINANHQEQPINVTLSDTLVVKPIQQTKK